MRMSLKRNCITISIKPTLSAPRHRRFWQLGSWYMCSWYTRRCFPASIRNNVVGKNVESYIKKEILNRVSAFQNYQIFSDVIAERTKPANENREPIKSDLKNSVIVFRLWRHHDHAEWRKRVSSSSRPLHSLACFIHLAW